ncbi:DUF4911 domain-containing protein [candidate division CSSED10-310 bacterium]|uniref:DUF4911 domain-containing protein n=1 Tax=candidate division CSSED10-310 bacterium TaxID=2855610 RepID=A0ABV6YZ14_UNCC1
MDTSALLLKIDKKDIIRLIAVFAGYDNLVNIRTLDQHQGKILIQVAPGCEEEVVTILKSLKKTIGWDFWLEKNGTL